MPSRRSSLHACAAFGALALLSAPLLGASAAGASAKKASTPLPAVKNGSNVSKEPVIAAGKGKPPTKLETKDLVVGSGTVVAATSTVSVKYVGANFKNGQDFTRSTWKTGQVAAFPLDRVVPGFAEGLVGMKVGGRREIVIPPSLGYGSSHTGPIVANETLVFVVDLEGVSGAAG
jgi:peptidylprolyl isomerase